VIRWKNKTTDWTERKICALKFALKDKSQNQNGFTMLNDSCEHRNASCVLLILQLYHSLQGVGPSASISVYTFGA
jgi:hypothetical protein